MDRKRRMRDGAIVAAVLAVLAAPAGLAAQARDPGFPSLSEDAPAGTGELASCALDVEGGARCGVYRVWENRRTRRGRTVDVHVVVVGAIEPDDGVSDALTVFGGGPGAALTDGAERLAQAFRPHRRHRDLVLFDFRGTGRSGNLACDVPYPGGLASRFGTLFPVDHAEACRDALSRRADLSWYHTGPTIDDVEEIRRWLGYSAFDLFGGSYGSREAQVYMRRYPGAVRTAVLNGVVAMGRSTYLYAAAHLQTALETVFADCRADARCAGAYPELEGRFDEVIERLDRDPPTVRVRGHEVSFSRGDFAYVLRGLLYGRSGEVPYWIDRAWRGDWAEVATYYLARTDWVSDGFAAGYHFSTLCTEDVTRATPERVAEVTGGTFMGDHLIEAYRDVCRIWPAAPLPPGFGEPVRSPIPTLLLSGARDPVTPASFAEEVGRFLPASLHVVVPGAGHGVGGPCIVSLQVALVETGSIEGLDPACVERAGLPPFRTPGSG